MDRLEIYRDAQPNMLDNADVKPDGKKVIIPFATSDGLFQPKKTRVVWPVACLPE
jgi:hypothetical protein